MRLFTVLFLTSTLFAATAYAGGVGLGATRVVYSGAASQSTLQVRNTHPASTFLIQSWVENAAGERSNDFIITPPLYVLKPSTESVVKIMFTGKALPEDRETLYWITVKAIPQQNNAGTTNSLQFASANRIKIFYRPESISQDASHAWKKLGGIVRDGKITLTNPTPYYLTTINLKIDGKPVAPVMVPPRANLTLEGSFASPRTLSYQIINDFGAWTPPTNITLTHN